MDGQGVVRRVSPLCQAVPLRLDGRDVVKASIAYVMVPELGWGF